MLKEPSPEAIVFNVQRFCLHDGPGIRTTIFIKGCYLHCQWCDNPESISPLPELGLARTHCNGCGKCIAVCSRNAIHIGSDKLPLIDRSCCNGCGDCVPVCSPEALTVYGKRRSSPELFQELIRDAAYFTPDGGVTVSGGEPLSQPSFVVALFQLCRKAGISTFIETSGFASPSVLKEVLRFTDGVMFDLKHMDSREHRRLTGRSNESVLKNARLVAESPVRVQFRIPLIPKLNSDEKNIKATAEFLNGLGKREISIELMPYHRLGIGKYDALDRVYSLDGINSASPVLIESVRLAFEKAGVPCLVSV